VDAVTATEVLHPPHGARTHAFDRAYWDRHYEDAGACPPPGHHEPPNPYLLREVAGLAPGTALEAGCGEGTEAIWLALAGWQVTAVDIAAQPLSRAVDRAAERGVADRVEWVRADLGSWEPARTYDLVTTHYAHPAMPQLEFYDRLSSWVAPGGSLLVVAHRSTEYGDASDDHEDPGSHDGHDGHGSHGGPADPGAQHDRLPPARASVTVQGITERLDPATWDLVTAGEHTRTTGGASGGHGILQDVVVRAVRLGTGPAWPQRG